MSHQKQSNYTSSSNMSSHWSGCRFYPQKSEIYTPGYKHIKSNSYNNETLISKVPSLFSMIGHQRLLNSLDNFRSNDKYTSKIKKVEVMEDRFIPSRKWVDKTYKLRQNLQDQQNQDMKDPQSISIAQIYSQQVLGTKQKIQQQIEPYRNNNIFKYKLQSSLEVDKHFYSVPSQITVNSQNSYYKMRKISKIPCKVLDAPALQDDFYLNLIDWSNQNQLAVGLGNCIYLWSALTSKVTKLCELNNDNVSSVAWTLKGNQIAIGCNKGDVLIWDVINGKQVRKLGGHQIRVGAMTWNSNVLATGSRDKNILLRDSRVPRDYIKKLEQHTQQICGLKWSLDEQYLASGGNDNKVVVWTANGQILNKFTDHRAAVKALAWSPHQHGLLATGGGTADRMIKMRNIFTGSILCEKDAGSQVCNIAFSKSLHEVVSTHGYSQNEINIWSYPNMKKVATLIGHTHRVLYLATSPDGSTIVTGAGDQTLRFWNVFPPVQQCLKNQKCDILTNMGTTLR